MVTYSYRRKLSINMPKTTPPRTLAVTALDLKQKRALIGCRAFVTLGTLVFAVDIVDHKFSYGRDRWLVRPATGNGEAWVQASTLSA